MKFRRFTLKHITLVTVLPAVVVWAVLTALSLGNVLDAGYNGLAAIAVLFLSSMGFRAYHSKYMKRAERKLYDDCDPYPTIDEVKLYLECAGKKVNKAGLTLTLGMMLALVGDYDNAEKELRSIDVTDSSSLPDGAKAGVYYDLAALYCAMSLPEHAIECYDIAKQKVMSSSERFRSKLSFDGPTDGEIECYKGNHKTALDLLNAIDPVNRLQEVTKQFALAKVHYITGERDTALSEFDWVAKNGGRLAAAKESADIVSAVNKLKTEG